jgi:Trk K+ transport system NAD-binding subunit
VTLDPDRHDDVGANGTLPSEHVIVCGLRELGLSIVEQLHFSGVDVVVVDDQPDRRLLAIIESWSIEFVHGSPRNTAVLTAAGLLRCQALICVEDDDLNTLETALNAHVLMPDLRIVVQMTNAAVARALTGVTGQDTALDVAAIAAPSIVQACLGQSRHDLELSGERFSTAWVVAPNHATLRSLYGPLVPIAVVPVSDGGADICPGRDRVVEQGDRILLLGTSEDLDGLAVEEPVVVEVPAVPRVLGAVARLTSTLWSWTDRGLRFAAIALLGLVITATLVIHYFYRPTTGGHLGFLTSTYFIIETVATVGFGDFTFANQDPQLRVFGIALIILGATLVTTMFALLTNMLVSRTLSQALGTVRGQRMRGHVVVVGFGAIGLRVVERLLAAGRQVLVVERDENNRHLPNAKALHVPIVIGDATLPATLNQAGAHRASAVAVLTSSDLTNLETAISLGDYLGQHEVDPPVIIRLFDRGLAQTLEHNFGLRYVRSTTTLAAPFFVGAALGLHILLTFSVEQERLLVARLTVAPQGGLAGLEMQELSARIRVIAIRRAGKTTLEHPPRRNTRFAPGDQAYLIGRYEELLAVLRRDAATPEPATAAVDTADVEHDSAT